MQKEQMNICLVLGASDTGKTTRIRRLVNKRAGAARVGVIDCDPGQSVIGPPGCVGWAVLDRPVEDLTGVAADGISFVGHVTPTGHLLQLLSALVRAVETVRPRCDQVLIDTPGYIAGGAAASLWWNVVRAVRPRSILALERAGELTEVLRGLERFDLAVERVHVPAEVPTKTESFRRDYRRRRMERYFEKAGELAIPLERVSVQTYHTHHPADWTGHIAALTDAAGNDRALAAVRGVRENVLTVQTPLEDAKEVAAVTIGDFTFPEGVKPWNH